MSEKVEPEELKEAARGAYRQLQNELERKTAEAEELKVRMRVVEATQGLLEEIDRLKTEAETMLNEIDGLNQLIQDKDIQLKELGKLSAGVAKKSSADDVSKAIRIYLNTSKRKTQSKREAAKTVLLELITAAKLELSEDIMESLNHFDDEELTDQPQPTGTANENVAELLTAEAQVLWQRLRDAGLIVADGYALAEGHIGQSGGLHRRPHGREAADQEEVEAVSAAVGYRQPGSAGWYLAADGQVAAP